MPQQNTGYFVFMYTFKYLSPNIEDFVGQIFHHKQFKCQTWSFI